MKGAEIIVNADGTYTVVGTGKQGKSCLKDLAFLNDLGKVSKVEKTRDYYDENNFKNKLTRG